MLGMGKRKTLPASRWGGAIAVMQRMGWTWQEYEDTPDELVLEIEALIVGEQRAERDLTRRRRKDG